MKGTIDIKISHDTRRDHNTNLELHFHRFGEGAGLVGVMLIHGWTALPFQGISSLRCNRSLRDDVAVKHSEPRQK